MFDAKKLLDQFLGSQMPGTNGSVRKGAGDVVGLAKSNPLATGAIAAVLLGSKTGRNLAGNAVKLGGLAVIAGLGYQAYKNYQAGQAPEPTQSLPELLPPPSDSRTELANPTDLDAMVSAARTEEQKVELYTASRLAIDPDTRAERGYLDMLAGRLGLADALVDHIEATVSAAKVQA